jgi:hypothetical protein
LDIFKYLSIWCHTPIIEELQITSRGVVSFPAVRDFLSTNPTVSKISILVNKNSRYDTLLQDALKIQDLSISGPGDGQWLSPLYLSTVADQFTGRPILAAPNLRRIDIHAEDSRISPHFFEGLVRVRFIAVDAEGHTSAGCKAADVLRMSFAHPTLISVELTSSLSWKQAEVTKLSRTEFELRWPDRPRPKEQPIQRLNALDEDTSKNNDEGEEEEEEDYHMFL